MEVWKRAAVQLRRAGGHRQEGLPAPQAPAQDIVPERKSSHAQFQTRVVDCGNLSEINFPFTSIVDFGLRN